MNTNEELGRVVKRALAALEPEMIFGLVATGKKEAFFRDLVARQIQLEDESVLVKPEWDISPLAARRWRSEGLTESKTKGIVDLAVLSLRDLFSASPESLVEFKLWYSTDCVSDSKFRSTAKPHHSIEKAAMIDVHKIRAARDGQIGNDYVVTFINTVHADEISVPPSTSLRDVLLGKNVQYANVHAQKKFIEMTSAQVRVQGIERAFEVISHHVRRLTHVECGRWVSDDVPISIDVLVGEI